MVIFVNLSILGFLIQSISTRYIQGESEKSIFQGNDSLRIGFGSCYDES